MNVTTAETLAGLAATASYRYSQHRAALGGGNGPVGSEVEHGSGLLRAPSDPLAPVGALPPIVRPPASTR